MATQSTPSMAYFEKPVANLVWEDLTELVASGAAENVRLEYKREVPGPHETLKKLSSFANTYGGDLIIGAEADADGVIQDVPGVEPPPNLKQTLVQRCYGGIYPPVEPMVSNPIVVPGDQGRVAFVVRIAESTEAPHFLNGRKGCYIRTDEFSERFEPRLATYEEIAHLASRRERAVRRRQEVLARAESRFDTLVKLEYETAEETVGPLGATMKFWVIPSFPVAPLIEDTRLAALLRDTRLNFASTTFPNLNATSLRQHESALLIQPLRSFSLMELGVWGNLFYVSELQHADLDENRDPTQHYALTEQVAGQSLLFMTHAAHILEEIGYEGTLQLGFRLERLRGLTFKRPAHPRRIYNAAEPSSRLDDTVVFEVGANLRELATDPRGVLGRVLRTIGFAVNWSALEDDRELERLISAGYGWNRWSEPEISE